MINRLLALSLVLLVTLLSCSDSGTENEELATGNARSMMGLQEDLECRYVRYDTMMTYPPLRLKIDTTLFTYSTVTSSFDDNTIDVLFDSVKTASLRITSNCVVNLGYYRSIADVDSLFQFAEPPVIFPIVCEENATWESHCPPSYASGEETVEAQLYLTWGLIAKRKFERRETLLLPVGTLACTVFKCELTLPGEEDPILTQYEYYADGVGLVKLYSTGRISTSHIFMLSYESVGPEMVSSIL